MTSYPLIFDRSLQLASTLAAHVADDELQLRISLGKATDIVHFKPMSPNAITETIERLPTLAMKCYCTKIFAFGFRADEAEHLSAADLDRGMVVYDQVVKKTKYLRRGKLKKVNASLGLRILLRAERDLGIGLVDDERQYLMRLSKYVGFTRKEMRTTAAFRIAECTKDIQIVRKRLGHRLLDMAVRHYLSEDDDERSQETTSMYYGFDVEEILLEAGGQSLNLWDGEDNLYDRFVLYSILGIFLDSGELTAEQKRLFVELVVEEYDEKKGFAPGIGAAKKRNRTFKAS